jgi:trehalose 6-phosphate phosphatase
MSAAMEQAENLGPPPPLNEVMADAPLALFVDFDGTLVDIAATPDAIAVPAGLVSRLVALADRLNGRLALVSGRAIESLEAHCGRLPIACAGSHGAALRRADGAELTTSAGPLPSEMAAEVARYASANGLDYEAKPHGAALHWRNAPHLEADCARFLTTLAETHGLAVKHGKRVAELVTAGCDKGSAVRAFMAETPFRGARPVFVGDDVTDEDGFAACAALGGFGVAVGERPSTVARYRLAGPREVHEWLNL